MDETAAERDRRVRGEEARMVRLEERIGAVHELMLDERRFRQAHEESLNKHMALDDQRFASIDSRMQGFQTQISSMVQQLDRIEKTLLTLERDFDYRGAVMKFLSSTYTHIIGGGGLVLFIVALASALDLI